MFLSTVIPTSKLNINEKNVDPYQFSVPYNFVRGKTISIEFSPVYAVNDGTASGAYRGLIKWRLDIENRLIITIPDGVNIHTANMDIVMYGGFGQQAQAWKYNVNITCDIVQNIITFTPISYTHLAGTVYRNYVDDIYTWPVLLTIHTKL